jgi:hypothetical protein
MVFSPDGSVSMWLQGNTLDGAIVYAACAWQLTSVLSLSVDEHGRKLFTHYSNSLRRSKSMACYNCSNVTRSNGEGVEVREVQVNPI